MPQRILSLAEHELILTLVEPFQSEFIKLADAVNLGLADVEGVAVRVESCRRYPDKRDASGRTQAELWAIGRQWDGKRWRVVDEAAVQTYAKPGESAHEYAEAGHLVLHDPATGAWLPAAHPRWHWLGALVLQHGHVWGGNFKTPKGRPFFDAAHVESRNWRRRAAQLGWRGLPS